LQTKSNTPLRIGTRGSQLALAQAHIAMDLLKKAYPQDPNVQNAQFVIIKTTGDRIQDRPLSEVGGKGLFSKELELALRENEIDFAVHSLKDMETTIASDMILAAHLEREDARDCLLSLKGNTLKELPKGAIVGTCAPRRIAQVLHQRPDLICVPLRGNVDSRIRKLHEGGMDAIILAYAGIKRLGREDEATYVFPSAEFIPAVGQGALTLECRKDDRRTQDYLAPLNHKLSEQRITAERSLLAGLDGSCRTPIGGHATILEDGRIQLEAMIASPKGSPLYRTVQVGEDPALLGSYCATFLKEKADPSLWTMSCES
jgi:hydroxymethylbilane synthase